VDLTLQVLVSPEKLTLDQISGFCAAIARGGATVVQLRAKTDPNRAMIRYGQELREATRNEGLGFIVNDRVDVAMAVKADGVHVGQDDMPVPLVRAIAPNLLVGLSVSNLEEAHAARVQNPDYLGVGPIFPTFSKLDASAPTGVDQLAQICAMVDIPVVAIGGIGKLNVSQVWGYPIAGIAVISAVMSAEDKENACRSLRPENRGLTRR
jgi:thiamine-phosphate diphosphorylase